ncbi:MAG: hypothetical protein KDI06_14330, partial [Calditrichaeota bacterium]|nr:hypothetical protein [Calditrichota bacterium]
INYGGLVHRYLDFSGLACFKLVQTETFPYVVAGAHIAFLQSARRVDVTGATVEEFIPRESRTRNIDAGLVVGAGLYVPTGESNDLRFELLVNPGLLDIDTLSGTSAVTVHNFSVQLRILLVFQNLLKAGG